VNNGMVSITHFKVSHGDLISFQENDARTRGKEIRRSFYIEILVEKIIGKYQNRPVLMWRRKKRKWFKEFKTQSKCRKELKSWFLKMLRSYMHMQEKYFKRTGSEKVCLGCSFAEHNRMKRFFFFFKVKALFLLLFLSKRRNDKKLNLLTRTRSLILDILYNSSLSLYSSNNSTESLPLYSSHNYSNSTYLSASPHQLTRKRKVKRIELPTHYLEVNYRTLKAVVFYGPNIGHIPHHIRLKDLNLLLWSGKGRGQNI
jgi:small subunit ribosomal protein S4